MLGPAPSQRETWSLILLRKMRHLRGKTISHWEIFFPLLCSAIVIPNGGRTPKQAKNT